MVALPWCFEQRCYGDGVFCGGLYGGVAGCITKQVGQVKVHISSLKIHYIYIQTWIKINESIYQIMNSFWFWRGKGTHPIMINVDIGSLISGSLFWREHQSCLYWLFLWQELWLGMGMVMIRWKQQLSKTMTHVFIPFKKQSSALVASQDDQNKQRLPEQIGRCTGLGEETGTRSVSRPHLSPLKTSISWFRNNGRKGGQWMTIIFMRNNTCSKNPH